MRARSLTLLALLLLASSLALPLAPAHAASRVGVANDQGSAAIDPTYETSLRLTGSGFQSVRGGFGGIYVLFGTVSGSWRPSAGGGGSTLYAPDSQTAGNAGYQRFVAFPGSDTAAEANGGTIRADGRKLHPAFLFEVKAPSESKYPGDFYKLRATIPADEAFRPLKEGNCPMVSG